MNPGMKYIFGISRSRQTEWHPTSMVFFISNDFSLKKCHVCFRFHFRARNSARRLMNPGMKYIFGISRSRQTEWHPTSMVFFISNDFSLKKCHFCFRFHFRAQNSARRSMNSEMKYIFGISRSKHTRWVPETCGFFCFTPLYTQKSSRAILSLIVLCAPSRFCGVARDSLLAALMKGQWTIKSV